MKNLRLLKIVKVRWTKVYSKSSRIIKLHIKKMTMSN